MLESSSAAAWIRNAAEPRIPVLASLAAQLAGPGANAQHREIAVAAMCVTEEPFLEVLVPRLSNLLGT